ncbi:MAG: choice-of-anchor Q domain-containing protein, partial [Niastella sp.]|uniref:Ig-like domain-containing protein n=1 Tax=Niastella sp. TaxID=1869183 RepID=UPI00389A2525
MSRFRSLIILCLFSFHCCFAVTRYVNINNPTPGAGNSWATAFTDLNAALAVANYGDEIWVAQGTYKPTTTTNRAATFFMTNGYYVYGGFAGTETALTQRNPTINVTILSGDIGVPGIPTDNSYHVVTLNQFTNGYFIDGFTIRDGEANAGAPATTPQPDNIGGGVLLLAQTGDLSYGIVKNCVFTSNVAIHGGAFGAYGNGVNAQARYALVNCTFVANRGQVGGTIAGFSLNGDWGGGDIQNCIFIGNYSLTSQGSVLEVVTDHPYSNYTTSFNNNTLYDNQAPVISNQQTGGISYIFPSNDIVWQPAGPYTGPLNIGPNCDFSESDLDLAAVTGSNLNVDPQFVNAAGFDLHLMHCSPVVDKGFPIPLTFNYDMDNGARKQGNEIDMGAYESGLPLYPGVADVTYCQFATASPLTATPAAGNTLRWYANYTGGTGNPIAPTPTTNTVTTAYFYVSQVDATGCEGPRTATRAIIKAGPAAPTATGATYCQYATAVALTATGTSLLWYTNATTGTGSATAPVPSTATNGITTYYVSQTSGCESPRTAVTVTVNAAPAAPVAASPTYCQYATATALTATGANLLWYPNATTGTGSATAPVPSTATNGITTYYVSQTSGCESPRAPVTVTVNAAPAAPVAASPTYCQHATAVALTSTGTSLLWYPNATTGTGSAT